MPNRSRYVFVTLPEFATSLQEVAQELELGVVLYRGPDTALAVWDGSEDALSSARRAYLTTRSIDLSKVRADSLEPGRLGWLQLDVPQRSESHLLAVQVAAKSDWFDASQQQVLKNPAALKLFDAFWRKWGKRFTFPMIARNRMTGAEARYPDVGYSKGAVEWCQRGRELRQEGVENIEFLIP